MHVHNRLLFGMCKCMCVLLFAHVWICVYGNVCLYVCFMCTCKQICVLGLLMRAQKCVCVCTFVCVICVCVVRKRAKDEGAIAKPGVSWAFSWAPPVAVIRVSGCDQSSGS